MAVTFALGLVGVAIGMWFLVRFAIELGHLGRAQKSVQATLTRQQFRECSTRVQRALPAVERALMLAASPLGIASFLVTAATNSLFPSSFLAALGIILLWRWTWRTRQMWERLWPPVGGSA